MYKCVAYMHVSCVYMCAEPQSSIVLQFFFTTLEGKLVQDMRNKAQSPFGCLPCASADTLE